MEERNYKLYVHISPSNKRYYGITCKKRVQDRWDCGRGYYKNEHFTNAINKYGWENFEHIVLFDNLTKEEACLLEQMYIALYNTTNSKYGYNNSLGGEHGLHSEHTKKKMSEAKKGENNSNYGKHFTEEHRNKMSEAQKGRQFTEEHKKKLSEAQKGKHHTEETKKKLSEYNKGKKPWNYGKHFTEEQKKKMSEAHKGKNNATSKPILMFSKNNKFLRRFDCVADANEFLGKPRNNSNIMVCAIGRANGRNTTAWGYIWIYEENYIKEQEQAINDIKSLGVQQHYTKEEIIQLIHKIIIYPGHKLKLVLKVGQAQIEEELEF